MPSELPDRKRPAHWPPQDAGNLAIIIYVTVCAKDRKAVLASPAAMATVVGAWRTADAWLVGRYVFLPDHIHFFCAPRQPQVALRQWIKFWKSLASQHWPQPIQQPIWQRDYWDTQLRRGDSYAQKWDYVWRNPVRHGLVARPEDWPFSGELNVLAWHDR